MSISAALRQGSHIRVAAVTSRWQRVEVLIGSGFEPLTPPEPEAIVSIMINLRFVVV